MSLASISLRQQQIHLKSIAFDKDGTLIESQPFWLELLRLRKGLIAELVGETIAFQWEEEMGAKNGVFDRFGPFATGPFPEGRTLMAGLFYRTMKWPWDVCRDQAQKIYDESGRLLNVENVVKPRPGTHKLLTELKEAGVRVGIVTSDTGERARKTLEVIGLGESFWDFFYTASDGFSPKPAPDMIFAACKKVGCLPEEMAVVGDSIMDCKMSRNAGSIAIAVPEFSEDIPLLQPHAHYVLSSLEEINLD